MLARAFAHAFGRRLLSLTRLLLFTRLDYNELYRDLQDIFVISQKGIDFDSTLLGTASDSATGN
jgi:hypothetical protein